ncbi:MAG: hypothetical protein LBN25_04585 [Christensenellaceae bacterium]|nr:hypothetical protein [Christensenellaceae bacterium]
MKVKIQFSFVIFAVLTLFERRLDVLFITALSSVLHELAHAYTSRKRGYKCGEITLTPFGASVALLGDIKKKDMPFIAAAGPLFSFTLAAITAALAALFPRSGTVFYEFARVNVTIAVFNLLPLYPLDGSRILLAYSKKPIKLMRLFKRLSVAFSAVFLVLFISSIFYEVNIEFLIVALGVFLTAKEQDEYSIGILQHAG